MKKISLFIVLLICFLSFSGCNSNSSLATKVMGDEDLVQKDKLNPKDSDLQLGDQLKMPKQGEEIAVITMESGKVIKLRFFPEEAPQAVYNFKKHCIDGYYDGLTFHRVIKDFMIQGGDPEGTGIGGSSVWGDAFEDEFSEKLINITGAVAMANSGSNTNKSQFFINYAPEMKVDWDTYQQYYDFYMQDSEQAVAAGIKTTIDMSKTDEIYRRIYEENGGAPHLDGYYSVNATGHTVFAQVFEGIEVLTSIVEVEVSSEKYIPTTPVVIQKIEIMTHGE